MNPPPRHLTAVLVALGVLAVLSLLAADWNWARPALVRYLEHTSKREVQLDDLQIRLDADWQPVVRLRGLRVANAPWASGGRPFITAREARFTFDWASLMSQVRVMRKMELVEADIDLQRQPDGLRNWRLTRPDDRGGARLRVQRLQAERSRLTLHHRGLGLVLEAVSTPLAEPRDGHTQQVAFKGRYGGADWSGRADAGPVLSMVDTGERFPVRGEARSGETTLALQGHIADLMRLSAVDAQVQLQGDTLAQLQPFLPRAQWPESQPYRFEGRVVRTGLRWDAHQARISLGRSDLAGEASYTPAAGARRERRASLRATLHSQRLRLEDLPSRKGARPLVDPGARPVSSTRVLPQRAVPLDTLRALDGHVTLKVDTLRVPKWPDAHQLQATATLAGGEVQVQLQRGELAGGRWQGRFRVDTRSRAPAVTLQLQADGVKLVQLWPALSQQAGVQWPAVDGQLTLSTLGATWADWWDGIDGQLDLRFAGGSIPRKLDARLGLHAGRMLGSLLGGDKPVPIRCGAVSLAFSGGVGRTRSMVLETERTQVNGVGSVHLADESWALVLTPQPHGGTLPASIVAQGTFRAAKVELAQREAAPATGRCG
ncbi:AsmA family protein [Rhizobacter sp. J219]|uniref:AsmA family protein n=1 Tax=Rhizobacter sp. J219 TaxID=2898430 RepID=UPI00215148C4|nr:AsmA family protein [Rhizobacter sp. J219]MCR5884540.1 AsmA family protein [Rhizobacter sp. J219]